MTDDKFPVSDALEVIEGRTIYKTDKWWSAVVLLNSFGRRQLATYLWQYENETWKRRQKFVIQKKSNWKLYKEAIEDYIEKL
ncbi:MAG: hypothetical protein ACTSQY_10335 [Candidatus Odinarchaeia archaeon]